VMKNINETTIKLFSFLFADDFLNWIELTTREKLVLRKILLDQMSALEIAIELNLSVTLVHESYDAAVSQIEFAAANKLVKAIGYHKLKLKFDQIEKANAVLIKRNEELLLLLHEKRKKETKRRMPGKIGAKENTAISIEALKLPDRIKNFLFRKSLLTVDELLAVDLKSFLKKPGFGAKSLYDLITAMENYGIKLTADDITLKNSLLKTQLNNKK